MVAVESAGSIVHCPDADTLAAFNQGQLSATVLEGIAEHVSSCPRCASVLVELDQPEDSVVSRLRAAWRSDPLLEEAGCKRLDSRARHLLRSSSNDGLITQPVAPPGQAGDPLVGRTVGSYRIQAVIREGGMGRVYRAVQLPINRPAAVKMVLAGMLAGPDALARFRREGKAIGRLQHPHVVPIFEFGEYEGMPFYSMELMEGGSLADRIAQGPLPCRDTAELVRTLALALEFAHQRQVLHRDLKPGNILITRDGTPKIADFGLAKILDLEETQTRSEAVMGTPAYMAPEQVEGKTAAIGAAADTYALGVILYELLTGKPPFRGANKVETMDLIRFAELTPPTRHRRDIPRDLEAVCMKCLEKTAGRRYASAQALAEDLERWLNAAPTLARPRRWPARLVAAVKRRRVVACSAVASVVALAVVLLRPGDDPLPEMAAALASGKTLTLIANVGTPRWTRWLSGEDRTQTSLASDNTFAVHTTGTCLLQLLPDPQCDSYRLNAEVRHERAYPPGSVGLFVAQRSYPTVRTATDFFTSLLMTYNDIRSASDNRPAGVPEQKYNAAAIFPHLFCKLDHRTIIDHARAAKAVLFEPSRPAGTALAPWRKFEITVQPRGVSSSWDGMSIEELPAEMIVDQLDQGLAKTRGANPEAAWLGAISAEYVPRSGLGIYLFNGSASFRNVRITPLR